ncbi:tRNA (adenosine(37)-N6)-threonylcarbamoyltransferase complex ATPase subunit type 1 TsaE [Aequorivita viscosa]|uniref:tRNA threonylcarbamoyladenosine biosynthesis protein TsaE n=1 Tax=Aequorivita viscosa TaxID=797419 RepID=A0A1M6EEN0_9FLAO|nr:tRNA (adenosine(37)-N6)-threonylcarbamoyltransferase complex ATPase subunit type 1 TsaE [Aequorivita viscosa]SDW01582.1 tRNA threonylcarbamoyladenosine biosynthesis protein TsaE [Aequorivita viscosa]SHI83915.1 tRNA threonylcarbamoyladenosine biosynthesis protein TsaE [Aequorivita viscosa]
MKITYTHTELPEVAKNILGIATSRIFLFYGSMGVGKTTLIKVLSQQLGANEVASSPSFSIVNEYEVADGLIYHFDFYRIEDPMEALDLGVEDYLYSGHYVFIEWPEKIQKLLPEEAVKIEITKNHDGSRTIVIDDSNE